VSFASAVWAKLGSTGYHASTMIIRSPSTTPPVGSKPRVASFTQNVAEPAA